MLDEIEAVREVLREIGADSVPELLVFNKCDVEGSESRDLAQENPGSVAISALTGEGIEGLIATIGDRLRVDDRVVTLALPVERGDLIAAAHREGDVLDQESRDDVVVLRVVLDAVGAARFDEWRVSA